MQFRDLTYVGLALYDDELLEELPRELALFLLADNGFVALRGGFHVRGAYHEPTWHSLRAAWRGPASVASLYPAVLSTDIPFAQDAFGDQFLLRDGMVVRLLVETGEIESLAASLHEFLSRAAEDPIEYLRLGPFVAFQEAGGRLVPGRLLNVYPPFCVDTPSERSFRSVPADQQLRSMARLAAEIRDIPEGTPIKIVP